MTWACPSFVGSGSPVRMCDELSAAVPTVRSGGLSAIVLSPRCRFDPLAE